MRKVQVAEMVPVDVERQRLGRPCGTPASGATEDP